MNSNLNFLFALLAVIVIVSLALAMRSCGTPKYPPPFTAQVKLEDAVAGSRESGRPILAFFTADWCGSCQSLKRGALSSSRISRWIEQHAEPVYIDATRANSGDTEMQSLLARYRVRAFPTLMMLEPGRPLDERGRIEGNISRRDLLKWLERMNQ
jgi:thiol:disulfide interchange protein